MNVWAIAGGLLGGIGLFLLGMGLMADGLKLAAGPALERILAYSTKTRMRGLASGILVTAMVQSSSAVTVAAIGFVNAGLLTLGQSMWVLFGANVGTTMTGWLVALVGLKFKIEVLALPLIGIGMALRLSGERNRRGALGQALAGFGVLFLGIDMMKEAFSGMSADFKLPEGEGVGDTLVQVLIGIALTVLMQSSSASLTIALTAAQGGLLTAQGAAAMVIGANIGTTVTALIASIGATPNAKRAAAAHILFNILTGGVALLLLPWLVPAIGAAGDALELGSAPAAKLALFHTAFNLLGVMLIWPIADRMTRFLEERFRAAEEDEARPRYLDTNVAAVPALALDALEREVRRMGGIALRMMREALAGADGSKLAVDQQIVARLNQAVADFISHINRAGMSPDSARRLPHILRVARYYETVAELSAEVASAKHEIQPLPQIEADSAFLDQVKRMLERIDPEEKLADGGDIASGVQSMEGDYQILKAELLEEGAQGRLPVADMDARLRAASAIRRVVQQAAKAVRLLGAEASASGADQSSLRATQSES
ncbi:MAG: Na/Pi cotransporter family protein [Sulfurimicrobium sp.]|jgi:phosphate:Na+ symporter|nr:Na/Pi cotransporter family protein [Sulfurimicrobium sp.]MDP1703974.1 Na/Pi cotransporter family protein [Sulfurimicrobium sp.]MDP2197371.1 Na/Pi cotransporter family protein [Sulfurimicrobium sp.]MDP2964349.1 Na/Pi cotransporter family protein [Sulfurimicrobium sp.]MDZ7656346.1 Na/Pi cotransporter family protein [Sulfurimicrobium sp.]